MTLVARAAPVLADDDLRPALVRDHLRRYRPVAEQDVWRERLALVGAHAVHDERLALPDAVLLTAKTDDCVIHARQCPRGRSCPPRSRRSVAGPPLLVLEAPLAHRRVGPVLCRRLLDGLLDLDGL